MPRRAILPDLPIPVVLRAAAAIVAFASAWPLVRGPWAAGFREAGNTLAAVVARRGTVTLVPATAGGPGAVVPDTDTYALLEDDRWRGAVFRGPVSSRRASYAPLTTALALALARRRPRAWRAALVGAGAIGAYVLAGLWLTVAKLAAGDPRAAFFPAGSLGGVLVQVAYSVLIGPPGFELLVPAALWIACQSLPGGPRGTTPSYPGRRPPAGRRSTCDTGAC